MIKHSDGYIIVSVTELGVYRRCRQMWDYQYNQGLTTLIETPYLFVGRLTHQVLAEWTANQEKGIESIWADVLEQELELYRRRYHESTGTLPSQDEIDAVTADAFMPHQMIHNYKDYWGSPLPHGFRLLQAEQTCLVDIPETNVKLEGTLDGFVLHDKTNRIFVLERKTYSTRPKIEVLDNNDQFVGYSWILRKLLPDYELGGVLYDGLWKREITKKRPIEELFFRHLLLKSDFELQSYERNLIRIAKEIEAGPAIYTNRLWQGDWDCRYDKLCAAEMKGEDTDYMREFEYTTKDKVQWFPEGEESE